MNDTLDLLNAHCSVRRFKPDSVDDALVEAIIGAGQSAASSSFIQATTVIRVRNPQTRASLAEHAGGQAYVANAPVFLVFCADLKRSQSACAMQDIEMRSGFTEQFLIASIDAALFAQNAVIAAESLGLGICYIGALRNQPEAVSQLLALPEQVAPLFGLCLGYPDQDTQVKPRLPLSLVLREETYAGADDRAQIADYDQTMQHYYQQRQLNTKLSNWSEQISGLVGTRESRPHLKDFLNRRGLATR